VTPPETVVDATNHASMSEIRLDQIFVKAALSGYARVFPCSRSQSALSCNDNLESDPQSLHSAKTGFSDCSNTILDAMVVPFGFSIGMIKFRAYVMLRLT
jgi:hypothetical protein